LNRQPVTSFIASQFELHYKCPKYDSFSASHEKM
jgi:hypothetical protein